MKAEIYNIQGEKMKSINLPDLFESEIRDDIASKLFEIEKMEFRHPYSNYAEAGKRHSASGTISHQRHKWKGHYGKGISRVPRKAMWRRGTQFFWIGAEVASTRGGRRAHPPRAIRTSKKINKKEMMIALKSGLASTCSKDYVLKRYSTLNKVNFDVPIIFESKLDNIKSKDFLNMIRKIFGENIYLVLKSKSVRAGRGKIRGRKYKSNAGLLLIKSPEEKIKLTGIDIRNVGEVSISDLYPFGRLTAFTEKALSKMEEIYK